MFHFENLPQMKKLFTILFVVVATVTTAYAQTGILEQGVVDTVTSVRVWQTFDGAAPAHEAYQKWATGGPYSMETHRYTPDVWPASGQFVEMQVWLTNDGSEKAKIDMALDGVKGLQCKLLYGNGQSADVNGFLIAGLSYERERCLVTSWEGNLYFTLEPGEKTWMMLVFDVPAGVTSGRLQIREYAPIPVTFQQQAL